MLVRMYNLGMHTHLPLVGVPYQWVVHWSRLLESDLDRRRLEARNRAQQGAIQRARDALRRGR